MASSLSPKKVNFLDDLNAATLLKSVEAGSPTYKPQLLSVSPPGENVMPTTPAPSIRPLAPILKMGRDFWESEVKVAESEDTDAVGEQDLVAVREQCQFIKSMLNNLNYDKGDTHPQIRTIVSELHGDLRKMLVLPAKSNPEDVIDNSARGAVPRIVKPKYHESSRTSSSSETFESKPQSQSRKKRYSKPEREAQIPTGNAMFSQTLIDAIAQIDGRRAPKPEDFDLSSGRSFRSFLKSFEEYCGHTFKGSSSLWSSELKPFLKGSILQAFEALHVPGESYGDIKDRLLQFCDESQELVNRANRRKFEQITMRNRESLRLYAARMERDFRLAHPRKRVNVSSTLTNKFLETVPSSVKKHILNTRSILALQGQAFDWSLILKLVSSHEMDNNDSQPVRSEPDETEVWATTSPMRTLSTAAVKPCQPPSDFLSQAREFRSASRSSGPCSYCNRPGHNRDDCWRLNRRCLACGSPDHRIAQCSKRRSVGRSSSVPPFSSSRRTVSFSGPDGYSRNSSDDVRMNQGNFTAPAQQGTQRRS